MKKIAFVRSGGQTGVDRAALDAARVVGVPICGWCPQNGWAEDFIEPPGLLSKYPELHETPSSDVAQRTMWNVRDSHATLIVLPESIREHPGTNLTLETAKSFKRPVLVTDGKNMIEILSWLGDLGKELTLNVAGPRESEDPGVYDRGVKLFKELFKAVDML